jgi:hypothetical protein
MKYIRANTEGIIEQVSSIQMGSYTCTVETLPDDFYELLNVKYFANSEGIYIVEQPSNVPQRITKLQGVMQLISMNRYDELQGIITEMNGIQKIAYDNSHFWDRDSNMVKNFAQILNMSDTELDQFFIDAEKIQL